MLASTAFYEDPLALFVIGLILLILFFWYFATDVERRKRNVGTVLLFGVCALCILAVTPIKERLKGGIDILGGSAFSLRVQEREDDNGDKMPVTPDQVEQAMSVVQKRLDELGTSEPFLARQGTDMMIVQMPGVEPEEAERIRIILETTAKLELREVSPRNDEIGPDGKDLATRVSENLEIVPGYRAFTLKGKDEDGNEYQRPILLSRRVAVGGNHISMAYPSQHRQDAVDITLNGEGTDRMIQLTKDMRRGIDRIAIVLDGEVISAPVVQETPLGKNFIISGLNDPGEPQELAKALMNPLENGLIVEDARNVSATLGAAIIKQGIWAGVAGLIITFIFILLYYRTAGIIALIGLVVNMIILFGVMAMFGFTFSLPGIAGLILTIGMAVDANVLIYERLREEIASGKSLKNAIDAAYEKAFSAIFDANVTSLITAVVLIWMGSGTVKGFAITLTIGLLASMFSSILVTRVLYRWGVDFKLLKKLTFMDLIKSVDYDFLGKRRMAAMISGVIAVICIAGFVVKKDSALGIDFTGGTMLQFQLGDSELPIGEINKALESLDTTRNPFAQEENNIATGTLLSIRCDTEDAEEITTKLRETFPLLAERDADGAYRIQASSEEVSATIGTHFLKESLIALVLGLLGIMIYVTIRFEFAFALGGFVAIAHDLLISIGIIILLGSQLNSIHVGAILAIAGYSINDTIVIFDRIRENLLLRSGSVKNIMNEAVNATLSRTVITSATTIVTVALLSMFGGSTLYDFSILILVGLVVGTYSSIFVAAPVVLWWSNRKGGNLRKDVLASEIAAEAATVEGARP
jgi:SecD/SecF fusion protein